MNELLSHNRDGLRSAGRIPFLQGRPARKRNIAKDDITNLIIALGIHNDVSDFLTDKHLFEKSK